MELSASLPMLALFAAMAAAALALAEGFFLFVSGRRDESRKDAARARVMRHATRIQRAAADEGSILLDARQRGSLVTALTRLIPDRRPLDLWLYRAGAPMQLEGFAGVTVVFALLGYTLGTVVSGSLTAALFFAPLGVVPAVHVRRLHKRRMAAFELAFPDAIDLLCRSLKAGHPLSSGLKLVADEAADPVSTEISQVVEEINLGLDARHALQNLRLRMGTSGVSYFVNAVVIQRETGGDLPRVLEALASQTRDRIHFKTKVQTLVAQTSMSANVLACFPFIFAGIVSFFIPGYLSPMFESGAGRLALILAFLCTVAGWAACRRIAVPRF